MSVELHKAFALLLQDQQFLEQIDIHTKTAFDLYNGIASTSTECPSSYILLIGDYIANCRDWTALINLIPESKRDSIRGIITDTSLRKAQLQHEQGVFGDLYDVKWEMWIEAGRQMWQIALYSWGSKQPLKLKLNYEQLSLLHFDVAQIVTHLNTLQIDKYIQ